MSVRRSEVDLEGKLCGRGVIMMRILMMVGMMMM